MTDHVADYRLDDGVWLVSLADEPRVHSWGRSLAAASRHIREAADLWFEAEDVVIIDRYPDKIERVASEVRDVRVQLDEWEDWVLDRTAFAVQHLLELGLSRRDVALVLEISHQRVHQIAGAEPPAPPTRDRDASALVRFVHDQRSTDGDGTDYAMPSGYSGQMAAEIAGLTYRQLDYWARTRLVVPTVSGSARARYAYRDLLLLALAKKLLDAGLRLETVRSIVGADDLDLDQNLDDGYLGVSGDQSWVAGAKALARHIAQSNGASTIIPLRLIKDEVDARIRDLADRMDH